MYPRYKAIFAGLILFWSCLGTSQAAETPASESARFIDALGEKFIGALQSPPDTEARRDRLRVIFDEALDYETIAKFTLGRHWDKTATAERAEYVDVFRRYVVALYTIQLGNYLGETYRIVDEQQIDDASTIVSVEVDQPDAQPFMIDFRLGAHDGGPKIVDVVIEGVSVIVTKRSEFGAVVLREGVDGLIERLRQVTERVASDIPRDRLSFGVVLASFLNAGAIALH